MLRRLRERKEWKFFAVLPRADPVLAWSWWTVLILRGALPAVFAVAAGVLVGAVQRRPEPRGAARVRRASSSCSFRCSTPIHQAISASLGDRTSEWLYGRLTDACVRPPGMGHLEDPKLTSDLTVARDFDLGMTGPPLSISMDFIAGGLVETVGGVASAIVLAAYAWWAALVLARRLDGDALAAPRERRLEGSQYRRGPRRAARRRVRLSPRRRSAGQQGAAAVRSGRLDDRSLRRAAHPPARSAVRGHAAARAAGAVEPAARRRRERRGVLVARERRRQRQPRPRRAGRVRTERGRRLDDRVRRSQLGARRIGGAGRRRAAARSRHGARRARLRRARDRHRCCARDPLPRTHLCLSRRPAHAGARALRSDDSRRIVSRDRRAERCRKDHAREAAVPPLRPAVGRDRGGRRRHARNRSRGRGGRGSRRSSRISCGSSFRCATTSRRPARPTRSCARRSRRPVREDLAGLDTMLARGYDGGTDLSGGQWQRVALARALCAVQAGRRTWCCSTSRPRSSTCAARQRSSIASSPKPDSALRS